MSQSRKCALCSSPIRVGDGYIAHQRLNVRWHSDHPMPRFVAGEDISGHALLVVHATRV